MIPQVGQRWHWTYYTPKYVILEIIETNHYNSEYSNYSKFRVIQSNEKFRPVNTEYIVDNDNLNSLGWFEYLPGQDA